MVFEGPSPPHPQMSYQLNIEIHFVMLLPCPCTYLLLVFLCGYAFFPFAAKPIPAVTEFVAQLAILELLDNVRILSFQYLDVSHSFYVLIKDINIFK